tara:strand:- start:303 stop:500 length:198 start_codon:yes stop_codon:yes gene_type:complete
MKLKSAIAFAAWRTQRAVKDVQRYAEEIKQEIAEIEEAKKDKALARRKELLAEMKLAGIKESDLV